MPLPYHPERAYLVLVRQVVAGIQKHFQQVDIYGGHGDKSEPALVAIAHFDWIPPLMLEYGGDSNGFFAEWTTRAGQAPTVRGRINLLPLADIYQDWQGVVYFAGQPASPLADFKIVDFFADEACVGLYHTPARDPQLYLYDFEDAPQPLGVDIRGYLELLVLTLGYPYWPQLLVALTEPGGQPRPFQPQAGTLSGNTARQLAQDMARLVPGWSLAAFVQRYDEVRLPQ